MASGGRQHLETAKSLIAQEKFDAALNETKVLLESFPQTMGDEALYYMGVIYAHPRNPDSNRERSIDSFQILLKRYPESDLIQASEVWVIILKEIRDMDREIARLKEMVSKRQAEIKDLRTQIDKMKKVDLGIEEKKRRILPSLTGE
jgi:outer membrane protein assembly factor BamD (BamD/ComL family)